MPTEPSCGHALDDVGGGDEGQVSRAGGGRDQKAFVAEARSVGPLHTTTLLRNTAQLRRDVGRAEAGHVGRIEVDEGLDELADQRLAAHCRPPAPRSRTGRPPVAGAAAHVDVELLDELDVRQAAVLEFKVGRRSGVEAIGESRKLGRRGRRAERAGCMVRPVPITLRVSGAVGT